MPNTPRQSQYDIHPQFLSRWSPRAFSEKSLDEAQLMRLFEAARWSPSGSNLQPWRFIYAINGTPEFENLFSALVPFNQDWVKSAPVLVFLASVTTFDGVRPVLSHSFDAGAAWMSLALQAHEQGLITHAMAGLDYEAGAKIIGLPDTLKLECAIAIGYAGDAQSLPENLREREAPSDRQNLSTMVFKGRFSG